MTLARYRNDALIGALPFATRDDLSNAHPIRFYVQRAHQPRHIEIECTIHYTLELNILYTRNKSIFREQLMLWTLML